MPDRRPEWQRLLDADWAAELVLFEALWPVEQAELDLLAAGE